MSSRKRPLAEISQPYSTPSRYAPSTPHAIRALQQRSGAKTRSARSVRHASADAVRPDSIRGVLRRFAKISAPVTRKRVATPTTIHDDKENRISTHLREDDNDSFLMNKPSLTFSIQESIEEDDSELLVAPTPSVLPDDDEDEDDEQPTITFQNVIALPHDRNLSERIDRRRSVVSLADGGKDGVLDDDEEQDGDVTIMTERGRRALSENATGRLSRYSFGSIRMSDFGSELEIRRESVKRKSTTMFGQDDYLPLGGDDSFDGGETENLRGLENSIAHEFEENTIHGSVLEDETFRLEMPSEQVESYARQAKVNALRDEIVESATSPLAETQASEQREAEEDGDAESDTEEVAVVSRRQTLLETATTTAQASRKKRIKLTRHGTTVPVLPTSLVKRVVLDSYEQAGKRKPKLGRDHIKALEQATEWFFEQVGEDLAAYSRHGRRRKRVVADDALLLMQRQKVLREDGELQQLARSWLPKEILDDLDLPKSVQTGFC